LQLKCTAGDATRGTHIVYRLDRKNYDDLRLTDLVVPRLLVVVLVPSDEQRWLTQTEEELILRRCAYWMSLSGREGTRNRGKVTVHLPRENRLSVQVLRDLMKRAAHKEPL
jgi:hypothetical protein